MSANAQELYTGEAYAASRPIWHEEDALWKAGQILKLLARNRIQPERVVDVGCGAGGVLQNVVAGLGGMVTGEGFDIAPYAIAKAKEKETSSLHYYCDDFLATSNTDYDLLLCIDVFEHVEDYIGFLRQMKSRSRYFVFHIPLDMNVKGLLRNHHLRERREVGHLHYFEYRTAIATLDDVGFQVMDSFYTAKPTKSPLTRAIRTFGDVLAAVTSRDFSVKVIGDSSLLAVACART